MLTFQRREMKERSKLLREGGENGIVASSRIERNCDLKLASNNSTTVRCHIWFVPTRFKFWANIGY
jgi:hypothetical protein